ncbi:hypothetical protein V3C99_003450, partial [Haemonchus contortus]
MRQMHTGGRERTAHTGEYGQTDADRTRHGRTCSDGGGRARTKGRTRTDADKHRQRTWHAKTWTNTLHRQTQTKHSSAVTAPFRPVIAPSQTTWTTVAHVDL